MVRLKLHKSRTCVYGLAKMKHTNYDIAKKRNTFIFLHCSSTLFCEATLAKNGKFIASNVIYICKSRRNLIYSLHLSCATRVNDSLHVINCTYYFQKMDVLIIFSFVWDSDFNPIGLYFLGFFINDFKMLKRRSDGLLGDSYLWFEHLLWPKFNIFPPP